MKNKVIYILVVVVVIAIIVIGRSGKTESSAIKIGVAVPLSGLRADIGEYVKNALAIAEEYSKNDKELLPIEFVFEDTKYEPQTAVAAVKKMIDFEKVDYIIGTGGSSEAMAVAPIAEQNRTILIITGAQTDELSKAGDYIFRTVYNSAQEVPIFAPFIASKMKSDTVHILALNTAITDPYLRAIVPILTSLGKKVGIVEKFDSKTTDFQTHLLKLKDKKLTDILLVAVPKQIGLIIKKAREMEIGAQFYGVGIEGYETVAVAGELADGYYYPYSYDDQLRGEYAADFHSEFVKRFGRSPDMVSANSYDAAMLVSRCAKLHGDKADTVKTCLYNVKDYEGVSGRFSIDANGDAIKNIFIKTIRGGKFVRIEE